MTNSIQWNSLLCPRKLIIIGDMWSVRNWKHSRVSNPFFLLFSHVYQDKRMTAQVDFDCTT